MSTNAIDPPEFDRAKVPGGQSGEFFFDGRTGRGLTNDEYDEQLRRLRSRAEAGDAGAADLIRDIRGRG